jgi:O-methyltransferase
MMKTNPVSVLHKSVLAIGVLVLVIFSAVVTVLTSNGVVKELKQHLRGGDHQYDVQQDSAIMTTEQSPLSQLHEEHDHKQLMEQVSGMSKSMEEIKKSLLALLSSDIRNPADNLISASTAATSSAGMGGFQTSDVKPNTSSPFPMPIKGEKFEIFQPLLHMDESKKNPILLASPHAFLATFEERITWVDSMVKKTNIDGVQNAKDHAILMYLEMIKSFVSASSFNRAELSVKPMLSKKVHPTTPFNKDKRMKGDDWTYSGDTMTGWDRIDNVYNLLKDVIKNDIKGDYIETGVWRGGSSVFAKAVLSVLEPGSTRVSYVCDSFHGLPPGDRSLDKGDKNWDNTPYLEVSSDTVANNFIKYNLLDSNVVFAKGFFNETMPVLSKHIQSLSIMRLDVSIPVMN